MKLKNKKNIHLFIKQGLKSLFKNKFQIVILFILTVLSTTLLTGAISSYINNNNAYNQVISDNNDYDYYSNDYMYDPTQLDSSTIAVNEYSIVYDLLPNYISRDSRNIKNYKEFFFNDTKVDYLNPYNKETDPTNKENQLFANPFQSFYNPNIWEKSLNTTSDNINLTIDSRHQNILEYDDNKLYWGNEWNAAVEWFNTNTYAQNTYNDIISCLSKQNVNAYINHPNDKTAYTSPEAYNVWNKSVFKYSLIANLLKKYNTIDLANHIDNKLSKNLIAIKNDCQNYILNICNQVASYIRSELRMPIDQIVNQIKSDCKQNNYSSAQQIEDYINNKTKIPNFWNAALPFNISVINSVGKVTSIYQHDKTMYSDDDLCTTWKQLSFEYITGLNYDVKKKASWNSKALFNEKVLTKKLFKNNLYIPKKNLKDKTNDDNIDRTAMPDLNNIVQYGNKGLSINLNMAVNSKQNVWYGTKTIDIHYLDSGAGFEDMLSIINPSNPTADIPTNNLYNSFMLHKKMSALLTGFNVDNLTNSVYTDDSDHITYNFISLGDIDSNYDINNNNYSSKPKITLFQGKMPTKVNQVVISPEFAHKHHIKVGDFLQNTSWEEKLQFEVSGIGIDALNFYPTTDSTSSINNTAREVMVYANKYALLDLLEGWVNSNYNATTTFQNSFYKYVGHDKNASAFVNTNDNKDIASKSLSAFLAQNPTSIGNDFIYQECYTDDIDNMTSSNQLSSPSTERADFKGDLNSGANFNYFNTSQLYKNNMLLFPRAENTFLIFLIFVVSIILVISIIASFIMTKNAILKDSEEISFMKSLGVKKGNIMLSYILYTFIVSLTIPIGWLLGILLQFIFTHEFSLFFSLPLNTILFSGISLIVSITFIGLFSISVGIYTTHKLLKSDIQQIKTKNYTAKSNSKYQSWIKGIFKKRKFNTRFKMNLFASSSKKIISLGSTILFSSIIISLALILPMMLNTISNSYFHDEIYKNSSDYHSPLFNDPLSAISVNGIDDPNNLEHQWDDKTKSFINRNAYIANNNEACALPEYLQGNNSNAEKSWKWVFDYLAKDPTTQKSLNSYLLNLFTNQFAMFNGHAFNDASFDYAANWFKMSPIGYTQDEINKYTNSINDLLNNDFKNILSKVLKVNLPSGPGERWQDAINDTILSKLPMFIKNYVNTSYRKENFGFGWNYINYIQNKETLITSVNDNTTINDSQLAQIGLPKGSNEIRISDSLKKQLYDPSILKQFDNNNDDITIPVVASKKAMINDKLSIGQKIGLEENLQELQIKNKAGNWEEIDPSWWKYDDTDYQNSITNEKNNVNTNIVSLNNVDKSKFTQYDEYQPGNINLGFTKTYINKQGKIALNTRPYYEYRNIELWIPKKDIDINQLNSVAYYDPIHNGQKPGIINLKDGDSKYPESTITKNNIQYYIIHPYDYFQNNQYKKENNNALSILVDSIQNLQDKMFQDHFIRISTFDKNTNVSSVKGASTINHNRKISYKVIGSNKIYNKTSFYFDQKVANNILNYSTDSFNIFKYKPDKLDANNKIIGQNPVYNANNPNNKTTANYLQFNPDPSKDPLKWFNGKMSDAVEPYDLSTNFGIYISQGSNYSISIFQDAGVNSIITNENLLSTKNEYIKSLTSVGLSLTTIFIVGILVSTIILILLISMLFIEQYSKFMTLMVSQGYSRKEVSRYTTGTFTPIVIIMFLIGYTFTNISISIVVRIVEHIKHIAIPYQFYFWTLPVAFVLIFIVYLFALWLSLRKLKVLDVRKLTSFA